MWWRKNQQCVASYQAPAQKTQSDIVECDTCKHMVRKSVCQERKTWTGYQFGWEKVFFCPMHRVKWERRQRNKEGEAWRFSKEVVVLINEDGSEIKPETKKGKKSK